eukprot:1013025-Rhodomonas_salina.1
MQTSLSTGERTANPSNDREGKLPGNPSSKRHRPFPTPPDRRIRTVSGGVTERVMGKQTAETSSTFSESLSPPLLFLAPAHPTSVLRACRLILILPHLDAHVSVGHRFSRAPRLRAEPTASPSAPRGPA